MSFQPDRNTDDFKLQVEKYIHTISKYHTSQSCQDKARQLIPWDQIQTDALLAASKLEELANLSEADDKVKSNARKWTTEGLIIMELMQWFKTFFKWFDVATCDACPSRPKCKLVEKVWSSNIEEITEGDATRTEVYECQDCGKTYKFPRYNNPMKLLETRKGRCGEWANCFLLVLRSLGFESRLVLDWTDHVWCEVYSSEQQRWIHTDTCEPSYDAPLLYECGWGKKLTYCMAISEIEIQDVTWRYTLNLKEILRRRPLSEVWLNQYIDVKNGQLQNHLPLDRKCDLLTRRAVELAQLLWHPDKKNKKVDDSELKGRLSGDILWRMARNETKGTSNCQYVITPSGKGSFLFSYNPASDEYVIEDNGTTTKVSGWRECTSATVNVMRKVEPDWNMVYLARGESSPAHEPGTVSWSIRTPVAQAKKLVIYVSGQRFHDTSQIMITLKDETRDKNHVIRINEEFTCNAQDIPDNGILTLSITLSGGSEQLGWQQSQLFRTPNELSAIISPLFSVVMQF